MSYFVWFIINLNTFNSLVYPLLILVAPTGCLSCSGRPFGFRLRGMHACLESMPGKRYLHTQPVSPTDIDISATHTRLF